MTNRHERRKQKAVFKAEMYRTTMTDLTEEQKDYFLFYTGGEKCMICGQHSINSPPHSVMEFHIRDERVFGETDIAGIVCDACISLPDLEQRFYTLIEESARLDRISDPGNMTH